MNMRKILSSIKKNNEPLNLDFVELNEQTNTITVKGQTGLEISLGALDGFTFDLSGCESVHITLGDKCRVLVGDNSSIKVGSHCMVNCTDNCRVTCSWGNTVKTGSNADICVFDLDNEITTGDNSNFRIESSAVDVKCGEGCSFTITELGTYITYKNTCEITRIIEYYDRDEGCTINLETPIELKVDGIGQISI